MGVLDYIWAGVLAVFQGPEAFSLLGIAISITLVMVFAGFLLGILVGATPGLNGPFIMAVSLPILVSAFGFSKDALLPVLGFLVAVMKGATVGGAVPAILFNTPGTPDALMTTLDGYPMAKAGNAGKALRTAHFASVTGDTFSDLVLFTTAPFLALLVEGYLGYGEKAALIILSLSFVAAVVGVSPLIGLISALAGLFVASIGSGSDSYARLSMGSDTLSAGLPLMIVVLGILVISEIFIAFEVMWIERRRARQRAEELSLGDVTLSMQERKHLLPYIGASAVIGTVVGALPGIGSTIAATLGYAAGQRMHKGSTPFGKGAPEGVAATEAANSAVSGANLIPVLSLGIPGNIGAVFLILAADTIGGLNPGPSVFRFTAEPVNPELVIAFGLFTAMMVANILNWLIGGHIMQLLGVMIKIPKETMMPIVLLLTITAIYVQETNFISIYLLLFFGLFGYGMKKLLIPVLPFVISFVLAGNLEDGLRQAFAVSGADPLFLFKSPISVLFLVLSVLVVAFFVRAAKPGDDRSETDRIP